MQCQVVLQTQEITESDVRPFPQSNIILIMRQKNKQWLSGFSSIPPIEGYTSVTFLTLSIHLWKLTLIKKKEINVIKFSKDCKTLGCYDSIAYQGCGNYNFIWHWQHTTLPSGAAGSQLLLCLFPKPPSQNKLCACQVGNGAKKHYNRENFYYRWVRVLLYIYRMRIQGAIKPVLLFNPTIDFSLVFVTL